MCRRTEEEVEPTVGLPRHRHFVGFFNVPVQTRTRDPPFYGYSEKPPHFSRLLRHAWGYGGHILDLNPLGPHGGSPLMYIYIIMHATCACMCEFLVLLFFFFVAVPSRHQQVKIAAPLTGHCRAIYTSNSVSMVNGKKHLCCALKLLNVCPAN